VIKTAGNCVLSPELESRLSSQKNKLNKLAYRKSRGARQLICLLHGPGGSGKTAVIDLTLEYCREFCGFIEGFKFTPQTIVVSALSGVAATNLLGDTIHRSAYLCQKCRITPEQVQRWCGVTRLVIVDEISFASRALILKLHTNLSILMQNRESPYGGARSRLWKTSESNEEWCDHKGRYSKTQQTSGSQRKNTRWRHSSMCPQIWYIKE